MQLSLQCKQCYLRRNLVAEGSARCVVALAAVVPHLSRSMLGCAPAEVAPSDESHFDSDRSG